MISDSKIQTLSLTVTDDKGNPNYPIDPKKPIVINAVSKNAGGRFSNRIELVFAVVM